MLFFTFDHLRTGRFQDGRIFTHLLRELHSPPRVLYLIKVLYVLKLQIKNFERKYIHINFSFLGFMYNIVTDFCY